MIIQTQLVAAIRCHECGRLLTHPISLFRVGANETETIRCTCGNENIVVGGRRPHEIWVRVPCSICSRTHFLTVPTGPLLHGELHTLTCPVTMLDLGFIGNAQEVGEMAETWEQQLDDEFSEDWSEFFDQPDVMYELLDRLHTLAEAGELVCPCGSSKLEMEIYPDRLELRCESCGREDTLLAIDEDDLLRIQTLEVLRDPKPEMDSEGKHRSGLFFWNRK